MSDPTHAQVALALVIARLRPHDISMEDYIVRIREIIVDKSRASSIAEHQYIDGTLFWKQAFEKCEDEKAQLEDKLFELEQLLRVRDETSTENSPPKQTKRRFDDGCKQNIKANTQSKRRKVTAQGEEDGLRSDTDVELPKTTFGCQTLLRVLFQLRQMMCRTNISQQALSDAVSSGCQIAISSIKDVCRKPRSSSLPNCRTPSLAEILKASLNLWKCMLTAIIRTGHSADQREGSNGIANMVIYFQAMLGQIHQHSLDQADRCQKRNRRKKSSNTATKHSLHAADEAAATHQRNCNLFVSMLCKMLDCPEWNYQAHRKLLEGILSALLDHIGSSLSLMIFAEPIMEKQPFSGLLPPRGLIDVEHVDNSTALMTCRISAPYLVCVLRKAIAAMESAGSLSLATRVWGNEDDSSSMAPLMTRLRNRLQQTLLRGIFGDDDLSIQNPFDRVEMPDMLSTEEVQSGIYQTKDDPNWFVGQVWECLGWDVLVANMGRGKGHVGSERASPSARP